MKLSGVYFFKNTYKTFRLNLVLAFVLKSKECEVVGSIHGSGPIYDQGRSFHLYPRKI